MGKNLQHQESLMSLENHSPGCMWGLFHHFQNNRWNNAKKRLPRNRRGSSPRDQESIEPTLDAAEMDDITEPAEENSGKTCEAGDKHVDPNMAKKSSMKARIRALITDEMTRRKGRHRRSTSCPTKVNIDPTDVDSSSTNKSINALLDTVSARVSQENQRIKSKSGELHISMINVNYLKQSEVHEMGREPIRDHTLVKDKAIYAIEPSKYSSLQESKLYMDALDLLNMRKEVFLKILQDPNSSLAHQLHIRRAPKSRPGLTKSVSFPGPMRDVKANGSCRKEEDEEVLNGIKRNDNKVALKRFKNLGQKIKNVIRDRKKEKNRIIMDAVHHKIPYGQMAQEFKTDKFNRNSLGSSCGTKSFRRTSSFNEQFDRYSRLLDGTSTTEGKDRLPDGLKCRTGDTISPIPSEPATMARILSLPDLRAYSSIQIEDDSVNFSSMYTTDNGLTVNINVGTSGLSGQHKSQNASVSESWSQENLLDVGETFDDSVESKSWESASSNDFNLESAFQASKENPVFEYEPALTVLTASNSTHGHFFKEDTPSANASDNIPNPNTIEIQVEQFYEHFLRLPLDTKNRAEFSYVKDVLEASGFTKHETLTNWLSAEKPVNPLVFERVQACDDGTCSHMLLFGLINEVLLAIHERSFCYWPMPLCSISRVKSMPTDQRILKEVWGEICLALKLRPTIGDAIDDAVSRDLSKTDGWMHLQMGGECVGLEVEEMIFHDLLQEIVG